MYTIKEIETQGLQYLELISSNSESKVQLCLNQGGRLSGFVFKNIPILADYQPETYKNNYASSILFPFANRIKDGEYTFNNTKYKFDCNEVDKNNALHGFVYYKTFICIDKKQTSDYASVTLEYKANGKHKGFPFKFNIQLIYKLGKTGLSLTVKVNNEDEQTFPFTLGWHPYFISEDLYNSSIVFDGDTKYLFDKQQIISGTTSLGYKMPFQLKDIKLDNGYPLKSNEIEFLTPKYNLKITTTSKENFLQLFTPKEPNTIAIEPMTGAVDNFNNNIGLQTLNPKETYNVEWNLILAT